MCPITLQATVPPPVLQPRERRPPIKPAHVVTTVGSKKLDQSLLWTIHGHDYDMSDFVERHPGGREAILLGRGRDCTSLFESYHPFTTKHRSVLSKYRAITIHADGSSTTKPSPIHDSPKDPFYDLLKRRAFRALCDANVDPIRDRACTSFRAAHYFFILCCLAFCYYHHLQARPIFSFLFAVFAWFNGALGHDAGHFSSFSRPFFNDLALWATALLANPIMWQHQHTYAHHSFTNEFENDPDLHHFTAFMRYHRRFPFMKNKDGRQRYPLYVYFSFIFVVFGTCLEVPIRMMITGYLYNVVELTDWKRPRQACIMMGATLGYVLLIGVGPLYFGRDKGVGNAILCIFLHVFTAGFIFALFSQINHLNESSLEHELLTRPPSDTITNGAIDVSTSWAARQVVTSNDFCFDSRLWFYLSNGLNHQIEHHLFPGLNHVHLHHLVPVVRATCEEYGVEYKSFTSFTEILNAMLVWLNQLSVDDSHCFPHNDGKIKSM